MQRLNNNCKSIDPSNLKVIPYLTGNQCSSLSSSETRLKRQVRLTLDIYTEYFMQAIDAYLRIQYQYSSVLQVRLPVHSIMGN